VPQRPNVVFLLADQLRSASLPIYGEHRIKTPNIDRLAAEGITFDNMVSSCPIYTSYRAMLLTGRHPQTTGHLTTLTTRQCADRFGSPEKIAATFFAHAYRIGIANLPDGLSARQYVRRLLDQLGIGQELTRMRWGSKWVTIPPSAETRSSV